MTTFITETSKEGFKIVGSSEKCHQLSEILIKAFEKESSHNRVLLTNNAFMVGLQVKLELGEEVYHSLDKFTETDWKAAWVVFSVHYDQSTDY